MDTTGFSRTRQGLTHLLLALFLISGTDVTAAAPSANKKAQLVINPATLDYGSAQVGSTTAAFTFTVQNTGEKTSSSISVSFVGTEPGDFVLGPNNCAGRKLASGASCTIDVSFKPTAGGTRAATLQASAIRGGIAMATLSGTGTTDAPTLSIDPTSYEFGPVYTNQFAAKQFVVSNTGTATTSPISVSVDGANASAFVFTDNCTDVSLAPGGFFGSCAIEVFFFPKNVGTLTATLHASATEGGDASASLSGTGVTPPPFIFTPASHDFGSAAVGSDTDYYFIEITNNSDAQQTPFVMIAGANPGDFALDVASCGDGALDPGQECHVFVLFRPTAVGSRTATLVVSGEAGESTSPISGTGTDP